MWINMEKRAFRLNGNAKNTKVGELHIDLLVHAAEDHPIIYANIVLEDEDEHQCLIPSICVCGTRRIELDTERRDFPVAAFFLVFAHCIPPLFQSHQVHAVRLSYFNGQSKRSAVGSRQNALALLLDQRN